MSDRYVNVRISTDGGHNWSNWREMSLGELGQFQTRVTYRRFGLARQFVFDIMVTSPIRADLIAASAQIEQVGG